MNDNDKAKFLNFLVTGDNFQNKSTDDYIYASLSQPPIKILSKNNSDDIFEYTVECPNCHRAVCYGEDIYMISGHIYCSNENCRETLCSKYDLK